MKLGIQVGITSGCAFLEDGEIVFAASEERYSNRKNETRFPYRAIEHGLKYLGITATHLDEVLFVTQKMSPVHFLTNREASFSVADYYREQKDYYFSAILEKQQKDYLSVFADKIDATGSRQKLYQAIVGQPSSMHAEIWNDWRVAEVENFLKIPRDSIRIMNHERSHAAYGYYGSPFRGDDVLVIAIDGFGDAANASVFDLQDGQLHLITSYDNFNVGRIYRYITLLLGMKPSEHEFKVMGLAPYASRYEYEKAFDVFSKSYRFSKGEIVVDPELTDHFFYYRDRLEGCRFDGIAGGLQKFTERMLCDLVEYWMRRTGKRRLVLSGGVSLNIKANMELGRLECVDDLFVVGSGGDESLCIGALFANEDERKNGEAIQPLCDLYLGAEPDMEAIEKLLEQAAATGKYDVVRNISARELAHRLAEGEIIGRVSGRMEFGARALGNRSILADPRSSSTIKKINDQIKNRDFWMPFTPSILDSDASRFLKTTKGFLFPYMSVGCESTADAQQNIKATLHPSDATVRPHVVTKDTNPQYYRLIEEFKSITGVGALLNTSLNLHGYPMVQSAEQGYFVLENSHLDGLLLEDHLISRKTANRYSDDV